MWVTGPIVLQGAYYMLLAAENDKLAKERGKMNEDNVNLTGIFGLKSIEIENDLVVEPKYLYDEIVPFNSTLNVTRGERINMESNTYHSTTWKYMKKAK